MDSIGALVVVAGGAIISSAVSAAFWDRLRWLRPFPAIYLLVIGLVFGLIIWDHREVWDRIGAIVGFTAVGLVCLFAVWIQHR